MLTSIFHGSRVAMRRNALGSRRVVAFRSAISSIHTGKPVFSSKEEEEPLPPSIFEKYNLYDPTRWVPITVGFFGITTATGIYHWDAESQMLGLFVVFCATVYSQAGPHIAKFFDDAADEIHRELTEAEEQRMSSVKEELSFNKQYLGYDADVKAMVAAQEQLENDIREAIPLSFQERKNAFYQTKLNRIVTIETEARESLQSSLIRKATDSVRTAYEKDKTLQDQSLQTALQWLKAAEGERKEPTEVGDQFRMFFSQAKQDPNITKDIETAMKENIDRVISEKFEVVDEYKYLKAGN